MNPYCLRWNHLQKGFAIENSVRAMIIHLGYRLSKELGIRVNLYLPALDIDNVDMRLHLENSTGTWAVNIEIAVRSSSRPAIVLGREEKYGTLRRWLKRAKDQNTPCIFFQFDWTSSRLVMLTPVMIRSIIGDSEQQSIPLPNITSTIEAQLFDLLTLVAAAPSEAEARNLLV